MCAVFRSAVCLLYLAFPTIASAGDIIIREDQSLVQVTATEVAADPATGRGKVDYPYLIGTHEVTNSQYAKFLNAVASGEEDGKLYSPLMTSHFWGGILRETTEGRHSYRPKPGYENLPVTFVSWRDAARYVNWLHYGRPEGEALTLFVTEGDAENGVYDVERINTTGRAIRNKGARFWLPDRDEWAKAAFYDPGKGAWQTYATPAPPENRMDAGPAAATFLSTRGWTAPFPHLTPVGSHQQAPSPWGTFDQAGNVMEWIEDRLGGAAHLMGGSLFMDATALRSIYLDRDSAGVKLGSFGFRIGAPAQEDPVPSFAAPRQAEAKEGSPALHFLKGIDFVHVPANRSTYDPVTGRGMVKDDFLIGRTETSNLQWAEFLNAVGPDAEALCLYVEAMGNGVVGGIDKIETQSGIVFKPKPGWENRPATYVTWLAAARYANWLHYLLTPQTDDDGRIDGDQRNGAYDTRFFPFGCSAGFEPERIPAARNKGALAFLPTVNEWYLAAYGDFHNGKLQRYWNYPNRSNDPPRNTGPEAQANYLVGDTLGEGPPYYVSEVDAYPNAATSVGTRGQGGNVWEWLEDWRSTGNRSCWRCDEWTKSLMGGSFNYTSLGLSRMIIDPGAPYQSYPFYGVRMAASSGVLIPGRDDADISFMDTAIFNLKALEGRIAGLSRKVVLSDPHRTLAIRLTVGVMGVILVGLLWGVIIAVIRFTRRRARQE